MHYLHKILVYIPDAMRPYRNDETYDLKSAIRIYAEESVGDAYCSESEYRETETAGKWQDDYPENILFAKDDQDRFVRELMEVKVYQYQALSCLEKYGSTDLAVIIPKVEAMDDPNSSKNSLCFLIPEQIKSIAALLSGSYTCASCFYNTHTNCGRIYQEDISSAANHPENWALALFDYCI